MSDIRFRAKHKLLDCGIMTIGEKIKARDVVTLMAEFAEDELNRQSKTKQVSLVCVACLDWYGVDINNRCNKCGCKLFLNKNI